MKAWEDVADLHLCRTSEGEFYINHGVKIERKNDGEIIVYNTMTNSDHYELVSKLQYKIFASYGFDIGAFTVCRDTYFALYNKQNENSPMKKIYFEKYSSSVCKLEKNIASLQSSIGEEVDSPLTN